MTSSRWSAATRFRRQMATGLPSTRPRRQAGSHGRSQVRPRMPGKHVRLAIEEVRLGEAPLRDQPDVFGHVGVRRTRPLAVHDLVVVARIGDVRRLHQFLHRRAVNPAYTNGARGPASTADCFGGCLRKDVARHGETVVTGGHHVDAAVVVDGDRAERFVGRWKWRDDEHAARSAARAEARDQDAARR